MQNLINERELRKEMKVIFLPMLVLFILSACTVQEETIDETQEAFCGSSSKGSCTTNIDCITAGCSEQICQSSSEEQAISTCEYRDCYDETLYDLSCSCVDQQCQWA